MGSCFVALRSMSPPSFDATLVFEIFSVLPLEFFSARKVLDDFSDYNAETKAEKSQRPRRHEKSKPETRTHCLVYLERRRPPLPPLRFP